MVKIHANSASSAHKKSPSEKGLKQDLPRPLKTGSDLQIQYTSKLRVCQAANKNMITLILNKYLKRTIKKTFF